MSRGRRTIVDSVNFMAGDYALTVGDPEIEAPPGWRWHKLGDVARLESGHTPSRQHPEYWDGKIPWIGLADAREHHGSRIRSTKQTVTQAGIDNSAARVLPKDTVCLSRTASIGYATVMDRPMATSQDFVNWVCGPEIEPEFLMHLFLAERDGLRRFSKGSTHSTIYFPEVQAFRVCAPPRDEQRRIIAKLDALRARSHRAKDALVAVPALLGRLRQSILAAAFRGDLTVDWREQNPDVEPASELLKRIRIERRKRWETYELAKMTAKGERPKDDAWKSKYVEPEPVDESELPELPEGWCWANLGELAEIEGGLTKNAGKRTGTHVVPLVTVAAVHLREIRRQGMSTIALANEDGDRATLRTGDLLVVEGNGSIDQLGRVALWDGSVPEARHQNHIIRVRSFVLPGVFLLEWLASPHGRFFVEREATSAAGLYNLSLSKLARVAVPLVPSSEASAIVAAVGVRIEFLAHITPGLGQFEHDLAALDRAVLAAAFRGELLARQSAPLPLVHEARP